MDPVVVAAIIAAGVSMLTLVGSLLVQVYGIRRAARDTDRSIARQLADQSEQLDRTLAEQREQLERTLAEQREQLERTLAEQRERTLNERFATAANGLGSDKPAVRLAGVYAMAGLADDWEVNRQTCVDVLCAYLRMPYDPDPGEGASAESRLEFGANQQVRRTVIRVLSAHLRATARISWRGLDFDFTGVHFDVGDFSSALFSGGTVSFLDAQFSGGEVYFDDAQFVGSEVYFSHALFSAGTVSFLRTRFSGGLVSFDDAQFVGSTVSFREALFSGGTVYFDGAQFSDGEVDFSSVSDWSHPPIFDFTGAPPPALTLPELPIARSRAVAETAGDEA